MLSLPTTFKISFLKRTLIFSLFLTLLSGCASYKPLVNNDLQNASSSIRVLSIVPQEEIGLQINMQNSAGVGVQFGLIGALVASSIDAAANNTSAKKAEGRADIFRNGLIDFSANKTIHSTLEQALTAVKWSNISHFEERDTINRDDIEAVLESMKEDLLIVVTSSYSLTPALELLEVDAQIDIYDPKQFLEKSSTKKRLRKVSSSVVRFQSDEISEDKKDLYEEIAEVEKKYSAQLEDARPSENRLILSKRNKEILKLKRLHKEAIQAKKDTALEAVLADLKGKYDPKLADAKDLNEKHAIKAEYNAERRQAKVKADELYVTKRQNIWLDDNAILLKNTLTNGFKELSQLALLAINSNINNSAEDVVKEDIVILRNGRRVSRSEAVLIRTLEENDREWLWVKSGGTYTLADYYSKPTGLPIYTKNLRH